MTTKDETTYDPGERVVVELPGGEYRGTVYRVLPDYAWSGETRYEVKGSDPVPFITITSERTMRALSEGAGPYNA